jgi:hypothetical protein
VVVKGLPASPQRMPELMSPSCSWTKADQGDQGLARGRGWKRYKTGYTAQRRDTKVSARVAVGQHLVLGLLRSDMME